MRNQKRYIPVEKRSGELCSPKYYPRAIGYRKLIDKEIQKIETIYDSITVDKYCIMPDHIHMILFIDTKWRTQFAPTISRVVKQFKGAVTKQLGFSIWQKSFNDKIIRNEKAYLEIWRYIDENPIKYLYEKH